MDNLFCYFRQSVFFYKRHHSKFYRSKKGGKSEYNTGISSAILFFKFLFNISCRYYLEKHPVDTNRCFNNIRNI